MLLAPRSQVLTLIRLLIDSPKRALRFPAHLGVFIVHGLEKRRQSAASTVTELSKGPSHGLSELKVLGSKALCKRGHGYIRFDRHFTQSAGRCHCSYEIIIR